MTFWDYAILFLIGMSIGYATGSLLGFMVGKAIVLWEERKQK